MPSIRMDVSCITITQSHGKWATPEVHVENTDDGDEEKIEQNIVYFEDKYDFRARSKYQILFGFASTD